MNRFLLLALTAGLALPNAVNALYNFKEDLMTDEKIHSAYHYSTTKTSNSIGVPEEAYIVVRCKLKAGLKTELDAYLGTPTYNADNVRIGLRWDGGTPKSETWLESKNNQQFFAPNDISFINKLASSDTLVFQWEPYSSSTRAVKFELKGFHEDLKKLSDFGCFSID